MSSQTRYDFALHKLFYCDGSIWVGIPRAPGFGCMLDGVAVPTGQSSHFYSAPNDADCNSIKQSRLCTDGELSGNAAYQYAACTTEDTTPDPFSFNDVTNAATSTLTTPTPATVTITGINSATSVSVSGQGSPQMRINGGAWVTSGSISNGQTLAVRLTSASTLGTTYSAAVNVGGVTDNWSVTASCGDALVGGYCWYLGAQGQDCDQVCASHGGCNLIGTRDYAGSGGNVTNCENLLDAVGQGSGSVSNYPTTMGCYYGVSMDQRARGSLTTNCTSDISTATRVCACNN